MKKLLALILAALMVFTMAACGGAPAQDPADAPGDAPSEPSAAAPEAPESSDEVTGIVEGQIADVTANTISVTTGDGVKLGFSSIDTDRVQTGELLPGTWVKLTYTGTLDGENTSGTTVIEVKAIAPSTAEGVVKDATMNTLMITNAEGMDLAFSTMDAEVVAPDGILIGTTVRVSYVGDLSADSSVPTHAIKVEELKGVEAPASSSAAESAAPPAPAPAAPAAPAAVQYYSVTGVILESSMHTVHVKTAKGNEYDFALGNNVTYKTPSSMAVGSTVKVIYTGHINGYNTAHTNVVQVTETAAPSAEVISVTTETMTGVVIDSRNSYFTIETHNGNDYDFYYNDKTRINCPDGYVEEGSTVRVSYRGKIPRSGDTSDLKVTKVTQTKEAPADEPATPADRHTVSFSGIINGDSSMRNLIVEGAHGRLVTFSLNDSVTFSNLPNGIMEGAYVTVYFLGNVDNWDASEVIVTKVEGA